jgi:predicted AlkP superfamily phosphohydrolase/phosphomutase
MTTRLLVIGLDGATLDLIEPWACAGYLPNLAALMAQGSVGRLRSTLPAMTLPAWSTFLTGCNPGRHGLFDFTRRAPGRYAVQFVNATHRREPTCLRRLSDAGLRVAALGIPTTYPPEPINGVVIAGFDSPVTTSRDASFVYPRELHGELRRAVGDFPLTDLQETRIGPGWHRHALDRLAQAIDGQTRVARYLLDREAWDCFAIVFGASDTVSHHFWAFHDPNSPRFDAAGAAEFGDAIRSIYQRLDLAVGELRRAAGPDADLFILSDHGFGGTSDKAISINRRLQQAGLFAFNARPPIAARAASALKRAGLSLLPSAAQQRVFRRLGGLVDALESRARFGHVDWPRTLAYSDELNYFPSVWINLRGREPGGIVEPDDYEATRDRVIDALHGWIDDETGRRIVQRAHRREDIYSGPALGDAPDIVLELALDRGYAYAVESARTPGPGQRRLARSEFIGAKGRSMNGSHRPDGVLIAAGPSIARGASIEGATLADLAPTLLAARDLPAGDIDGRVLRELLVDARTPAADIASLRWSPQPELAYSTAEAAVLAGRLRALGYIE